MIKLLRLGLQRVTGTPAQSNPLFHYVDEPYKLRPAKALSTNRSTPPAVAWHGGLRGGAMSRQKRYQLTNRDLGW